jgi:hypothetical protein
MLVARISVNPAVAREHGEEIVERLMRKMTALMFEMASRIVGESIPEFFPHGAQKIAREIRAVPAELEGTNIVGQVLGGGEETTKRTKKSGAIVDYARVQELGAEGPWTIEPFPPRKALAFMVGGKMVVVRRVTHPGLEARPYMRSELRNMESKIIADLQAAASGTAL